MKAVNIANIKKETGELNKLMAVTHDIQKFNKYLIINLLKNSFNYFEKQKEGSEVKKISQRKWFRAFNCYSTESSIKFKNNWELFWSACCYSKFRVLI